MPQITHTTTIQLWAVSYTHLDVYKRQTYLDVNIGPAENDGEELMKWAVQLLQSEFDNVPLALDTTNMKAIEAGISVYNRAKRCV